MVATAFFLHVAGALGARVAQHDAANETESPIPTPEGYHFSSRNVNRCYGGIHPLFSIPPGYEARTSQRCPGGKEGELETWSNGESSHFGHSMHGRFEDPMECAKECNLHEECTGFQFSRGTCSRWNKGELQDLPMGKPRYDYHCYVKWEVKDLSGAATEQQEPEVAPPQPVPEPLKDQPQVSDCLCVWDVDRTLTAKQGMVDCPGTEAHEDIKDYAYLGGTLILSELAVRMKETFCGQCYFAVVSAGTASGPSSDNRKLLDTLVDPKYNVGGWVDGCPAPVWGTKVMCCGEGDEKMRAVRDIVTWMDGHGIKIPDAKVHFFDDKVNNIEGFRGGPFNAHQVSCPSRDSSRGGCGGLISEVVNRTGQHIC